MHEIYKGCDKVLKLHPKNITVRLIKYYFFVCNDSFGVQNKKVSWFNIILTLRVFKLYFVLKTLKNVQCLFKLNFQQILKQVIDCPSCELETFEGELWIEAWVLFTRMPQSDITNRSIHNNWDSNKRIKW